MVGASVGSFMNVVIYRLPAGLSLIYPPSRCPRCQTAIRASDNLPIFGWLLLKGRCRYCRAPISVRYPAVELAVAVLFAALAAVEPLSGGANLPGPEAVYRRDVAAPEVWIAYAYHLFLLCGLMCAALIQFDEHRLTPRLIAPVLVVGLMVPLFCPEARPVESGIWGDRVAWPWSSRLVDDALGLATGLILGCATWFSGRGKQYPRDAAAASAWVGAALGWQAASALAVLAAASHLLLVVLARLVAHLRRVGWISCLAVWTLAWIVSWSAIAARWPWLATSAPLWSLAVAVTAVGLLSWLEGRLSIKLGVDRS